MTPSIKANVTALTVLVLFLLNHIAYAEQSDANRRMPATGDFVGVSPEQAAQTAIGAAVGEKGALEANDERSRGPALTVYPKAAPAVVLVRAGGGHGTGFVVRPDGWVMTNHHVIEGASISIDGGYRVATVHLGHMENGLMALEDTSFSAIVYTSSQEKDLALLKLVNLPEKRKLIAIPLAKEPALPGSDCIAIGHPARGMLWTVRNGEVSGVGTWPQDTIDTVMTHLALTGSQKEQFQKSISVASRRKVLISTCGINPGDSGGPLLNDQGELIAVTFAIPTGGTDKGYSLDKFSYHVHLDEVREFIAQPLPDEPELFLPSPWPVARVGALADDDKNEKIDTWYFALKDGEPASGFLVDVDENTPAGFKNEFANDPTKRAQFDFEFAQQRIPAFRTFYDTDNDGTIDVILTDADRDGVSDLALKFKLQKWTKIAAKDQKMVDADLFEDEAMGKRFIELMTTATE